MIQLKLIFRKQNLTFKEKNNRNIEYLLYIKKNLNFQRIKYK